MDKLIKKEDFTQIEQSFLEQLNCDPAIFKKEVSFAIQHIANNTMLQKAERESILKAVLNVAQTGLSLNPVSKYAYLVPRYVKGRIICCLEPSYQGLVKLLTDTGSVTTVYSHLRYEGDTFELDYGSQHIKHIPFHIAGKEKGELVGAYAVGMLPGGQNQVDYMTIEELYDIRDRSESYKAYKANKIKSCIWVSDEGEMCRKTVIKRLYKYLPKSEKAQFIETAINIDNQNNGFDGLISLDQALFIERLVESSSLGESERQVIEKKAENMTSDEASEAIQYLLGNQLDPIASGHNYSQTDISKKLDNLK